MDRLHFRSVDPKTLRLETFHRTIVRNHCLNLQYTKVSWSHLSYCYYIRVDTIFVCTLSLMNSAYSPKQSSASLKIGFHLGGEKFQVGMLNNNFGKVLINFWPTSNLCNMTGSGLSSKHPILLLIAIKDMVSKAYL